MMAYLRKCYFKFYQIVFLILPASLLGEASDYNMPVGVTEVSKEIFDLHMLILWVCVWIGVVVFGIMFWSLWKYRKSKGAVAADFDDHFWLEIGWTVAATLILVVIAIPSTKVMVSAYDDSEGEINIMVTGHQWKWHYKYLEDDISFFSNLATDQEQINNKIPKGEFYLREVDEPLVIPVNKRIRFLITGNDVIHSWWVPDFAVKQDAVPGFINTAWTNVPKPGIYRGACTELCGIKHAFMPIVVRAVEQEEYDSWVANKIVLAEQEKMLTSKEWTKAELVERGEDFYLTNCVACHQVNGQGIPPVFPTLDGSQIVLNDTQRQIEILMEGVQGSAMAAFGKQYSEVDIASVITYTRQAWSNDKKGDGATVTPQDIVAYKNKIDL
ncbi:MAG TPA: cytochrome c oxidase subunit II [Gammaproteobacteria bacterium]|nr:cytochrome c oxidase subunit II [Gammaproteobacteria bacterium]